MRCGVGLPWNQLRELSPGAETGAGNAHIIFSFDEHSMYIGG